MTEYLLLYRGFARTPGWCHVIVGTDNQTAAVLVGDLDDNPGTSVINATEQVAEAISQRLFHGAGLNEFTLYEYYAKGPPDLTPTFFRIDWEGDPGEFPTPTWKRVDPSDEPQLVPLSERVLPDDYTFDKLTAVRDLELIDASEPADVVERARAHTVGPEDFREAMTPTITMLRALTAVIDDLSERYPNVSSQGFRELEADVEFGERSKWQHPIEDTHTFGRITLRAASDHARTFAAAFDAQRPPLYGHLALTKASLEASVVASWLNEPGIAYAERVKRGMCERLYTANEVAKLGIRADAETTLAQYEADAISFGWHPILPAGGSPSVDGTSRPSIPEGITRLIAGGSIGNPGSLIWSRLSAVTHAIWWGLEWALDLDLATPAGTGRATVPIGTEIAKVAIPALSLIRALRTSATSQFTLMGWEDDPSWRSVYRAAEAHEHVLAESWGFEREP